MYIPQELRERVQWVCWKYIYRKDSRGPTKVPINPEPPMRYASHNNPETWGTYEQARVMQRSKEVDGIGFVISADDPYTGIDLDKCIVKKTGEILRWGTNIADAFRSFSEYSPSLTGIKIWIRGKIDSKWLTNGNSGRRKDVKSGEIEIYSARRYFTITGNSYHSDVMRIESCQPQLDTLCEWLFGGEEKTKAHVKVSLLDVPEVTRSDKDVLAKILASAQGSKFSALYYTPEGWMDYYESQSHADLALCNILAYWTDKNQDTIDRLFRNSQLMRDKWERNKYREDTIQLSCKRFSM